MATAKKRGKSWHIHVCTTVDGIKIKKHFTGATKKEAEQKAASFLAGRQIKKEPSQVLRDACTQYVDNRESTLSPSTIRGYRIIIRNRLDGIGDVPIDEITPEMMQRHVNSLASRLSSKTVDNTIRFIGSVLSVYREDLRLHLSLPQKRKPAIYIPTDQDVQKLLSVAKNTDAELIIILAAFGSLRRGEISGLCVDCIYDTGIEIRRSHRQDEHGEWILDDVPKSYAGYRFVPLPTDVIAKLRKKAEGKKPGDTVFGMLPRNVYQRFSVALKRAGLPQFRFHALRHYFATYLHSKNISDHEIMKLGGWSDPGTLRKVYQHSTESGITSAQNLLFSHYQDLSESEK